MLGPLDGVHQTPVEQAAAEAPVAHVRGQGGRVRLQRSRVRLRLLERRNSSILLAKESRHQL